jgi:HEAT repeat protein
MKERISSWINRLHGSVLSIILTLVVVPVAGQAFAAQPIPVELKLYLKDYVAPTASIRAGFTPYKAQLIWGEPLQVTFTVQNFGPDAFKFTFGGDDRGTGRHDRFTITMTDSDGKALPDPIQQRFSMGGFLQPVNLKTGQVFSNLIDLAAFRVIDKPGIYTVHCSFPLDERWTRTETTNPVVDSIFTMTILERTPERVATVLDELVGQVQAIHGQDLHKLLALMAHFGKDDAVSRLGRLAEHGPVESRAAALGALSMIPTDASFGILQASLQNSDPVIRAAAAGSLGTIQTPPAVDALLESLPREKSPVAEAIVLALGASKSDRAFPAITNKLDSGEIELQRAAVNALASFGGSNAIVTLTEHINPNCLSLRYEIVRALVEKLHQPMQPEWLLPLLTGREQNHEWLDSLRLLRLHAGDKAIPTMLSCLDFDVAWSGRNWWILNEVRACPKAPPTDYAHDYNTAGTPEQWEQNLRTLQALKPLAGPIPAAAARPKASPVPYLETDPPIDFTPTFKDIETGGVEIKSGFLTLTQNRGGASFPYRVSDPYRTVYQTAALFRSLPHEPKRCAELHITSEQVKQLEELLHQFAVRLCGPRISEQKIGNLYNLLVQQHGSCPHHDDWTPLLFAYKEAPGGLLREQAKADLIDSVRVFSQNYHAGTVEFVEAAKKVFSSAQLEDLLRQCGIVPHRSGSHQGIEE